MQPFLTSGGELRDGVHLRRQPHRAVPLDIPGPWPVRERVEHLAHGDILRRLLLLCSLWGCRWLLGRLIESVVTEEAGEVDAALQAELPLADDLVFGRLGPVAH